MYDITSKVKFEFTNTQQSFQKVQGWIKRLFEVLSDSQIVVCLVGNKLDKESQRQVSFDQGEKYAKEQGFLFFEASAKNGTNIEKIISEICKKFPETKNELSKDPCTIILKPSEPPKSGCC